MADAQPDRVIKLKLSADAHRQFKIACARAGLTMSTAASALLEKMLSQSQPEARAAHRSRPAS